MKSQLSPWSKHHKIGKNKSSPSFHNLASCALFCAHKGAKPKAAKYPRPYAASMWSFPPPIGQCHHALTPSPTMEEAAPTAAAKSIDPVSPRFVGALRVERLRTNWTHQQLRVDESKLKPEGFQVFHIYLFQTRGKPSETQLLEYPLSPLLLMTRGRTSEWAQRPLIANLFLTCQGTSQWASTRNTEAILVVLKFCHPEAIQRAQAACHSPRLAALPLSKPNSPICHTGPQEIRIKSHEHHEIPIFHGKIH